ncbi:MAG: hypothetical protein OHK93_006962 [Ramalina farinacea]|uniref:Spt20-like SEP domain-containing protein n=1 Tax=Ramalina farinacea TaxID=258253 RepID=A0AA43QMH0_9LECA|nr:hypothetical protein [Ramalina farinacea]
MKRPPLPAVQTNGIQPSQSSPSPLMSSKRPPSGFKAPPTPTLNSASNGIPGVQPRLSQRRKDSQKPGDLSRARNGKDGISRPTKRGPEKYVKDQEYILAKYRGRPPSLIIHLHPNNFRFENQNGSFSYNSAMKFVLEHLQKQTIPYEMVDELFHQGVKYYENCLIVQVKDHRNNQANSSSQKPESKGSNLPFSVHNYSEWVTPSPYVPFPTQKEPGETGTPSLESEHAEASAKDKDKTAEPRTYTVVLFPTQLSLQEEIFIQANTPDVRPGNRKAQGANVSRTPASGTTTVPPTPLSAVPQTPVGNGPAAKKQKMSISGPELHEFESKAIHATSAPLFLEPVDDLAQAHELLDKLTDDLHREKHPAPKTRKRTVAELAEEERIAAQEQAFMLIMDEKAGNSLPPVKPAGNDAAGTVSFEPSFESFNALAQIKLRHEERLRLAAQQKQRDEAEGKVRLEMAKQNKAQKEQQERAEKEEKARIVAQSQRRQQVQTQQMQERERMAQIRAQQIASQNAMNQVSNGVQPNGFSHAQLSSPVIRNGTPHSNASPVIGGMMGSQAGGVPMQPTSSGQGGSPPRPPSAAQHGHPPAGGIRMVQQGSRQQHPSRTSTPQMNGTPNMAQATPHIPHSTPIVNQGTPTSRMSHASPPNMGQNPNMNMMPNGQMGPNGQRLTQEQLQIFQHQQQQHRQREQYFAQQRHLQANGLLNPAQQQQLALQQQQHRHNEQMMRMQSAQAAAAQAAAMNNGGQGQPGNMLNGSSPARPPHQNKPQQNPQQPHPSAQPRPIPHVANPQQQAYQQQQSQQGMTLNQDQRFRRMAQDNFNASLSRLATERGMAQNAIPQEVRSRLQSEAVATTREQYRMLQTNQQQDARSKQAQYMAMIRQNQMNQMNGMGAGNAGVGPGQMGGAGMQGAMPNGDGGGGGMNFNNLTREQQQMMQMMAAQQQGHGGAGMNGMNGMNGMG